MSRFLYKAKDGPGRTVEGEMDVPSRAEVLHALDRMGYSPVSVREADAPAGAARRAVARRVSARDVTLFTRQLASLTRSGVPILQSLRTIAAQSENARLARTVEDLENTIRGGSMLSEALGRHPALFSDLYVNMVKAGESGGVLDTILERLADARENEEEMRRKVQSAVAYPALVLSVGLATVVVLLTFFLPRIRGLFEGYHRLPLPTQILLAVSDFFAKAWYWMLLVLALAAAVFRRFVSVGKGRIFVDGLKLRVPVVGTLLRQSYIARFARTFSLLLESGIPIDRGLTLSAATMGNAVLREEIEAVRRDTVQQGAALSEGLRRSGNFPLLVANVTAVGEEGGRLEESLREIASYYEKEVDHYCRLATSLLEPVLVLVVGVLVGFIVAAMLLPIFEVGSVVR